MNKKTSGARKSPGRVRKRAVKSLGQLMRIRYLVELAPIPLNDGGGYLATIPLLKGCQTDGKTPDEAIKNLHEARKAWFTSALKHGDPIPIPH